MAEWLFNKSGSATLIFDETKIRSGRGDVVAWIAGTNVYDLNGSHVGWFDGGVIYDSNNCALAFCRARTGWIPSQPGISGTPGLPGFSGTPGRSGFSGAPGRPGFGGWSAHDPKKYFGA
jgi:hypothetical protein